MYEEELKRVEMQLQGMVKSGFFVQKDIYLFGASVNTRQIVQILRQNDLEPVHILDNDKMRQNSFCSRIQVISPKSVNHISDDRNVFIIFSAYWREMILELKNGGVKDQNIVLLFQKRGSLIDHIKEAVRGKKIYDSLLRQYGNLPVFLCPYTGTGDIYLIGTFWSQYLETNGIQDYIFLVISEACKKAAMLFGIKNIVVLQQKSDCPCLISYYMLCPDRVRIKVLNDSWPQIHTNCIEWFRGYKGLGFTELFRRFVFSLPDTVKPKHPLLENVDGEIRKLFRKYKLKMGNTVVLSPYANTLADLPDSFWKKLAVRLKKAGYVVCTNSSGSKEPAVKGTVSVFYPLNIAPQFVEKAGYFIGVRNGFCDIISGTKAKKIILYDSQDHFYNESSFGYFGLAAMGLCDNASEIVFSNEKVDQYINKIIQEIQEETKSGKEKYTSD